MRSTMNHIKISIIKLCEKKYRTMNLLFRKLKHFVIKHIESIVKTQIFCTIYIHIDNNF